MPDLTAAPRRRHQKLPPNLAPPRVAGRAPPARAFPRRFRRPSSPAHRHCLTRPSASPDLGDLWPADTPYPQTGTDHHHMVRVRSRRADRMKARTGDPPRCRQQFGIQLHYRAGQQLWRAATGLPSAGDGCPPPSACPPESRDHSARSALSIGHLRQLSACRCKQGPPACATAGQRRRGTVAEHGPRSSLCHALAPGGKKSPADRAPPLSARYAQRTGTRDSGAMWQRGTEVIPCRKRWM